jgi:hypothetical protein
MYIVLGHVLGNLVQFCEEFPHFAAQKELYINPFT